VCEGPVFYELANEFGVESTRHDQLKEMG